MTGKSWIACGGLLAAAAVACGALGAHGLDSSLRNETETRVRDNRLKGEERDKAFAETERRIANFETAVRYHMYHALAVILTGIVALRRPSAAAQTAGWLFIAGVVLFSGMLYGWVLFQSRSLAMIVPVGGVAFIIGWLALARAAWQIPTSDANSSVDS